MALPERDLVHQHLHLVRIIARRVRRELDGRIDLEDLEGHGTEGLLQAARRYDPRRGASFATFAGHRIRGAMLDAVRALGRYSRREVAAYRARPQPAAPAPATATEPDSVASPEPGPDEIALARERRRRVRAAVGALSGHERHFIHRMYFDGALLTAAGGELGLSKSWASRVHARAVGRLRAALAEVE
jgi:RNA polymerase sigma factor for flagellar operon FliA